jgi:hypothetical protein
MSPARIQKVGFPGIEGSKFSKHKSSRKIRLNLQKFSDLAKYSSGSK